MNLALLAPEVSDYLEEHQDTSLPTFILKGSPFTAITVQELAQQLEGLRKAKHKLPLWYANSRVLYPPKLNLEQTSSQVTAQYKASLMHGKSLADGTGGYGIDTYHFAQKIPEITHIERDEKIAALATYNIQALGQKNIRFITGDAIAYFENYPLAFDTIFLDPGRRSDLKGRVFMLKDCLPNIPLHKDILLSKCKRLWIKTAPLLDISAGIEELRDVAKIHIVAVKNEVKELLWELVATHNSSPKITVVNLETSDPILSFNYSQIFEAVPTYSPPQKYLYEPNAALMKSGAFYWVCDRFNVTKLDKHSHLYTSDTLIPFAGRRFEIEKVFPYSKKTIRTLAITKANITTRNFPLKVEDIRKKLKIIDGGNVYLFFTTLKGAKRVVLVCKKITSS